MTENELIDEIRDYVHNIHTAEPFHGFSFRELREVGEHFALPREKRIEELEKENADLEAQLESERDLPAIAYMQGAEKQKKKDAEQLIKAKNILRRLMDTQPPHSDMCEEADLVDWREVNKEAEQFLKEIEK